MTLINFASMKVMKMMRMMMMMRNDVAIPL